MISASAARALMVEALRTPESRDNAASSALSRRSRPAHNAASAGDAGGKTDVAPGRQTGRLALHACLSVCRTTSRSAP